MISNAAAWAALFLFAAGMTYAGLKDVKTMTITNRLVLLLAGAYALFAPVAGVGLDGMLTSAAAAAVVLTGTFLLFAFGWIGGGDAKLAAVAVLWLGADQAFTYLLYVSVAGALLTLALIQFRRLPLPAFLQRTEWTGRLHEASFGVPYGVALSAAALLLLPESPFFSAMI
ncbi:A24 family peptidase [Chelativorans sp. M5D2P16]|uniref:A24 family peptidase n=1 Tax=Chelativorans sp. M5D2P16 TaxID=3095678 RepID=UPI002ACA7B20|nr:prepilin peptidase [Chelativorans sp. M5D2P16]MDZ5696205.1 prepilin peptidase [Chelativorans sp. M5D2P16]